MTEQNNLNEVGLILCFICKLNDVILFRESKLHFKKKRYMRHSKIIRSISVDVIITGTNKSLWKLTATPSAHYTGLQQTKTIYYHCLFCLLWGWGRVIVNRMPFNFIFPPAVLVHVSLFSCQEISLYVFLSFLVFLPVIRPDGRTCFNILPKCLILFFRVLRIIPHARTHTQACTNELNTQPTVRCMKNPNF